MKRGLMTILAASVVLASAATQAQAGYTFDLRVTGGPTAATNGGKLVTNPLPGNYTVELWSQISGNTNFADDSWTNALFSVASNVGVGAPNNSLGAGSGITAINIPAVWNNSSAASSAVITADNVGDWGNATLTPANLQTLVGALSAVVGGGSVGQQVNANTWEVLLATYTINVANVNSLPSQTSFNVISPIGGSFAWSGAGKTKPFNATIDGVVAAGSGASLTSTTLTIAPAVVFEVAPIPEPASMGVLALGGLALLARRRKTA